MTTTAQTQIQTGSWLVDPAHSKVGFAVKHMGITTLRGEFNEFEGTLEVGRDLATTRVHGTVRVQSVDTNEPQRDDHLRSPDFFDAERYPELRFVSTRIEALDDEELRITGDLTIHGVTKEVVLHADVQGTDTDPWGNERVGLEVTGQFSRGDFDMTFNQELDSGNVVVSDTVTLAIDISAVKQA